LGVFLEDERKQLVIERKKKREEENNRLLQQLRPVWWFHSLDSIIPFQLWNISTAGQDCGGIEEEEEEEGVIRNSPK
jgi:hypothetical protein